MLNRFLDSRVTESRYAVVKSLVNIFLILSFLTRIVLMFSIKSSALTFEQVVVLFLIGLLYDVAVVVFVIIPFVLQLWLQNNFVYRKKVLPVVSLFFLLLICLLLFTDIIPKDYNPALHMALVIYLVLRYVIYLVLYFKDDSFRKKWRKGVLYFGLWLVLSILLLNAISEWFFWQEFSTRYNFIAVDYLVYTTEVLGNIKESYPIGWILVGLSLLSCAIVLLYRHSVDISVTKPSSFGNRSLWAVGLLTLPLIVSVTIPEQWSHFSRNEYANSLAGNGMFEFATAFQQNELDFNTFYQNIPDSTAFQTLRADLRLPGVRFVGSDSFSIEREISYKEAEQKLNVVLISVESLSAEYMYAFGNTNNITPYLDSLKAHSLFFNNLYASGTRTVRGLEALSLSIPPTPGQSTVKRPDNANHFSLGSVFKSKGYTTQYIYGGNSYFDNMKSFFSGNGYSVIDRSAIPDSNVHYQNIWGVADEDLFTLALQTCDADFQSGKPFFTQVMTVSNHRPYTYPDGRIDIPSASQTRYGAVKYTDYAINKFLHEAAGKRWFKNTVFVIVSDHCAGSAGSVELPVTGYHIPMLIYAPGLLAPKQINDLTSQIDIPPTILGLLHFKYHSKFFGQDVLNTPPEKHQAFISTYQGLGFLKNHQLVIQSPVKKVRQFVPDFSTGNAVPVPLNDSLVKLAVSYYQCANWLLKNKKQGS
jgi:phosphoglycerol transferase MdoB-like AlkP superfamily enzyme